MKIAVIGTGYVGLVTGTCFAHVGHSVMCVDIDEAKVKRMQQGELPIYEPGLADTFSEALHTGRLKITTDLKAGIKGATIIFLALPTPSGSDGSADLSAVLQVADQLGPLLEDYTVVVNKSTVPVGTGEQVAKRITANTTVDFDVVSNPEFLREGLAVEDFTHPDRIVVGTSSEKARKLMATLYETFIERSEQLVLMDLRSAELTKYAANSFLAMKVSFMNEIANLCELLQTDVDAVRLGIGPDPRIGRQFLQAGIGYGGSCFPKDVQALQHTAQDVGYDFKLLDSIICVNSAQKQKLFDKLYDYYKGDLRDRHIALWGLAFKPDTDDIRESPALNLITRLLENGATVSAYDPEAISNARKQFRTQSGLNFAKDAQAAAKGADALLLVTDWREFKTQDFDAIRHAMKAPVMFDGRNMYDPQYMRQKGFDYCGIGRP